MTFKADFAQLLRFEYNSSGLKIPIFPEYNLCISQGSSDEVTYPHKNNGYFYIHWAFFTLKVLGKWVISTLWTRRPFKSLPMCNKIFYNNDMLYSLNSYFCNAKEAQWRWNRKSLSFQLHQTQSKIQIFRIFYGLCDGERRTFCKKMHKSCKQRELRPISNGSEK